MLRRGVAPGVAPGAARLVLAMLLGATAVGCGDGERDNTYIAHSEAGLFLRLPPDWETFQVYSDNPAADPLTDAEAGPWRLVFDGAHEPDRAHLEEPTPEEPVGFVEIQPTPQGTGLTTYAEMRSLLGATDSADPVDPLDSPDFDVLDYEEFDIGGYYGNRLTADTAGGAGDIRVDADRGQHRWCRPPLRRAAPVLGRVLRRQRSRDRSDARLLHPGGSLMAVPMPPGPPTGPPGSLAWPSHDAPPTPPRGPEATKREGETRRPLPFWDRVKFLWLFALIFAFVLWRHQADNPLLSFNDAFLETWESLRVLEVLFVVELLRQIHYLVSEHSRAWHHFVTESVFGRWNRFVDRREPWTRFRVARAVKLVIFLAAFGAVLGVLWDLPWYQALFDAPARIGRVLFSSAGQLPMIFQFAMIMFIAVGQFVAIFWFLSRGGTDVYRPQDIKTRFTDVWGQDPVLDRVQENMVFLEDPRSIEDKGGYVPGGILLWGPPGTGKTLLAEAVAGETGKPFVFVEPGAFNAMFFGVGIMKVKALYRKLRKLAAALRRRHRVHGRGRQPR